MELYVLFVLFAGILSAAEPDVPYPRITKQYRPDYVYNRETDSFYKLHIEPRDRWDIGKICAVEGAELMSPKYKKDVVQLHAMFKRFPDLGQYVWVANDGLTHESAEEQPIIDLNPESERRPLIDKACDVVTRQGEVETIPCNGRLPFMCKVKATDAPYDQHCGVFAKDYKYYSSVRSCYGIPRIAYTWSEAYSECHAQGAHLLVINSEAEREAIHNFTNTELRVREARTSWFFFAGFRATAPLRNFKTIFNETLEQAGFSEWSSNEPNNALGEEYCGSIFKNDAKLNDVDCRHNYAFICEKEIRNA